ncbi:MAG: dockerin type I repeat-containing protein [Clostridia bacterium]|nr:dockerin type I repeat-containing protein [Clostridia bacterium]
MKKVIAIIMIIAMVAAFVPTTLAQEEAVKTKPEGFDKSQMGSLDHPEMYSVDNYGNKVAGSSSYRTTPSNFDDVSKEMRTISAEKTKGWVDSTHYGVALFDQSESLTMGYQFENVDFPVSADFYNNSQREIHGMFFSPAPSPGLITDTGFTQFNKGDRFWFNFDIISGYGSQGPTYYLDKDGEKQNIPFSVYMYSGSLSDWQNNGLTISACWQSLTRISTAITVPESGTVYMFFIVIDAATVAEYGIRGFNGWLTISDYEKGYKEAQVEEKIETGKQYTADLGDADSYLLYGEDVGNVLAYGKLYSIDLKADEIWAVKAEGDGTIGGRIFFMDENKDIISSNFLGTGAVTGMDSYETLAWALFPPVTGTYHIFITGFCLEDDGKMDFEVVPYAEAQANSEYLPYFPEIKDMVIDLDAFGEEEVIESVDDIEVWGYFWDDSVNMGILCLAYPGTYQLIGEKTDMMVDMYDGVKIDMKNARTATVFCNGTFAPCTINATGESEIMDAFYGCALMNYDRCYSSIYITGDTLTISGEKSSGALLEVPAHILTKEFNASATPVSGAFTVAFWCVGWNAPKLTFGANANITNSSGSRLQRTSLYFDSQNAYLYGYSVSEYPTLQRYQGDPDFYHVADHFTATTAGTPTDPDNPDDPPVNPDVVLGDANCDGNVNTGDATAVLKHAAGSVVLEGQSFTNADINQDSNVNTGDATMILKVAAGIIPNPNN